MFRCLSFNKNTWMEERRSCITRKGQNNIRYNMARSRTNGNVRIKVRNIHRIKKIHKMVVFTARGRNRTIIRIHASGIHRISLKQRPSRGVPKSSSIQPTMRSGRSRNRSERRERFIPTLQNRRHSRWILREGRRKSEPSGCNDGINERNEDVRRKSDRGSGCDFHCEG